MLLDEPDGKVPPKPEPSAVDWFATVVTASMSAIPHWSAAPAAFIFSVITATVLGARRDDWLEELRLELNEMNRKIAVLTPEALSTNQVFISALVQATQAANRTHEPEKREALKNGVVHVAIGQVTESEKISPADPIVTRSDVELMFLNMIDGFTPTHFQVLKQCAAPTVEERERLRKTQDLSDQAIVDLLNRGLIRDTRPYLARNRESTEALIINTWDVSRLGKQFIDFISRADSPDIRSKPRSLVLS
jgi:hypothetical protein